MFVVLMCRADLILAPQGSHQWSHVLHAAAGPTALSTSSVVVPGQPYNKLSGGIDLLAKDMHTLTSGGMINDEVINCVLGLFQVYANTGVILGVRERWLFIQTHFMEKLFP